jgi:hypothetical protein
MTLKKTDAQLVAELKLPNGKPLMQATKADLDQAVASLRVEEARNHAMSLLLEAHAKQIPE